jgi:hypothetical protein
MKTKNSNRYPKDFLILDYLTTNTAIDSASALYHFDASPQVISKLLKDGFIYNIEDNTSLLDETIGDLCLGTYKITDAGRNHLEEKEREYSDKFEHRQHEYRLARYNALIGGVIGLLAGLLSSYLFNLFS